MTIKQIYRTTMRKANGDLLTPVLIFSRLQGTKKFLLESSAKYEEFGRYSFIGANPRKTYSGRGQTLTESSHVTGATYNYEGDLVHLLKQVMPRITNHTEYPFTGGAIGYINYGASFQESRHQQDALGLPDVQFQVYDTMIIFDHLTEEIIVLHTNIEVEQKEIDLDAFITQILSGTPELTDDYVLSDFQEINAFPEEQIARLLPLPDGEQLVYANCMQATFSGDAFALYRKLRVDNAAPYMFYVQFDDHTFIGTAPQSLISVHHNLVKANPMHNDEQQIIAQTTTALETVCVPETIQARQNKVVEVAGTLLPTAHAIDALSAIIPPAAMIGYPRTDAMQLIDQLEPHQRSFFGGAIGYIGFNGQIDFAHSLHSILIKDGFAYTHRTTTVKGNDVHFDNFDHDLLKG